MAKKVGKKFGTVIVKCGGMACVHKFQDAEYGRDNRVANIMGKGTGDSKVVNVRCTICLKVHTYRLEKEDPSKPGEGSDSGEAGGKKRVKSGKPKDDQRDKKAQKGRNG